MVHMTYLPLFVRRAFSLLTLTALLLPARTVAAQAAGDSRWQPFFGCWEAPAPTIRVVGATTAPRSPLRCVVPSGGGADVLTVSSDGKVTDRQHFVADGSEQQVTRDGCTGVEGAGFSKTGFVVYVHSSFECEGNLHRSASGLFSMTPKGEWIDIEGVTSGKSTGVRVLRFVSTDDLKGVPSEITEALKGRTLPVSAARTAAIELTAVDIADASIRLPEGVVQAWLMERERGYVIKVNAAMLTALADQGVPPKTVDVLVALAYPRVFALDPSTNDASLRAAAEGGAGGTESSLASGSRIFGYDAYGMPIYDYSDLRRCLAYSMSYLTMCDRFGMLGYSAYGYGSYGRYGYANNYGYPWGGGGYPGGGWYAPSGPVVVTVRPTDTGIAGGSPGHVVKGRGYSEGSSTKSGNPSASATSGSSGSAGASGSSSGAASPAASSERTAKPKP